MQRITINVLRERLARVNSMRPATQPEFVLNADASGTRIDLSTGAHITERGTNREAYAFLEGMAAAYWSAEGLMIPSVWP